MRALVLGSGGSRIAYHAGVVRRLYERGQRFDLFAGSSAGALAAAVLAQNDDDPILAVRRLERLTHVDTREVWRPWLLGKLAGLWRTSAVNSAPLRRLVFEHVERPTKPLRVSAVNLQTGQSRVFTEEHPNIREAILASASIPGIFKPVEIEGHLWADGAIRESAPIRAAIQSGANDITVVLLYPEVRNYAAPKNAIDVLASSLDSMQAEILEGDLVGARLHTKLAACRATDKRPVLLRVIRPTTELLSDQDSALSFSKAKAARLAAIGYSNAKEMVG